MPNVISFNSITLTGDQRIHLGPPAFKKLRQIRIGELRSYRPKELPKGASGDADLLRAMSSDVEELQIGVLTIFRGGLHINEVSMVQLHRVFSDNPGVSVESAETMTIQNLFDDDALKSSVIVAGGNIKVEHAEAAEITDVFTGAGITTGVVLVLPPHVEPTRKWAPVQISKQVKLTGG